MNTYKLFKKNNSYLKFLTPLKEDNKFKVAKLVSNDSITIGDVNVEDCTHPQKYIEIAQCPKIIVGNNIHCKNIEADKYEDIGKLLDIQYNVDSGYLFVF